MGPKGMFFVVVLVGTLAALAIRPLASKVSGGLL